MFSGTTLTTRSGRLVGTHQKIDRIARQHIATLAPKAQFPSLKSILHFEGGNGPDAVKRKSPGKDEPWHYIQPFDQSDTQLLDIIEEHHQRLVVALKAKDDIRAAFEAAWLAHAIVDGLTPAHHYPYEEKLVELRGGQGIETRNSFKEKVLLPGDTPGKQVHNNWLMWGPKGIFTTHWTFEWGISAIIVPLKSKNSIPTRQTVSQFINQGIREAFLATAQEVASKQYYDRFQLSGWTAKLANEVRKELLPLVIQTVTLSWLSAAHEAGYKVA